MPDLWHFGTFLTPRHPNGNFGVLKWYQHTILPADGSVLAHHNIKSSYLSYSIVFFKGMAQFSTYST